MKLVSKHSLLAAAALCLVFGVATGAERNRSTPDEQSSVALTIYNDDLGLVKDVRTISLPRGVVDLWFEGVAARIDPTSVHIRSLDAPDDLSVLEQNFEYDLISPERLMEKYVGKTMQLVRFIDNKEDRIEAKLLGTNSGYVYEIDGKIAINPWGRVELPSLPEGLISEPSLVWMLRNERDKHTIEASYLTGGISWKANYVVVLAANDRNLDLTGWVTIDNHSGATYKDATLKLVAGDVNRVYPQAVGRMAMAKMSAVAIDQVAGFQEESFFEYHLYTLGRKATVKDNQTKQMSLLEASDIGVEKTFVYAPQYNYFFSRMTGVDKNTKIGVYLGLENSKRNGLGMPLPKGIVRVYKKDNDGALQFIGEDQIDHTPEDEKLRIRMGNAFDIVAERTQTDFTVLSSGHLYRSSYKVQIRNHKEEDITVSVLELMSGDWEIERNSHGFEKEASHRVRFDIPVEAKGSTDLTYTVLIRY